MSRITPSQTGIAIGGELNLTTLMLYYGELQSHLPFQSGFEVDLSEVEFNGSAVLALLVMIKRHAYRAEVEVVFKGADERLCDMAALAGLTSLMGLADSG